MKNGQDSSIENSPCNSIRRCQQLKETESDPSRKEIMTVCEIANRYIEGFPRSFFPISFKPMVTLLCLSRRVSFFPLLVFIFSLYLSLLLLFIRRSRWTRKLRKIGINSLMYPAPSTATNVRSQESDQEEKPSQFLLALF